MRPEANPRTAPIKCLWIGRYIPYPMNEGAKVYSAKLAESLAQAGAFVRVLGFGDTEAVPRDQQRMQWIAVPGQRRSTSRGLFSRWPLTAAIDATPEYVSLLDMQLREHWDVIIFDGYGSGWALDRCKAHCAAQITAPLLVHVSHNHEALLWRSMARQASGSLARRLALRQNAWKVRRLEQRLTQDTDLVTAITEEDALALGVRRASGRTLVLTPGYDGAGAPDRRIDSATPRRVVVVGSFSWVVKRENLERFIEAADPLFAQHGIELVVAGDVPDDLQASLRKRCRATLFQGFVPDLTALLSQSRIAVVPELIGGGFKLKFLDYFFGRAPVATIAAAAAGLPPELRRNLLTSTDFSGLTAAIIAHIDQLDELNRLQSEVFAQARTLYQWKDRGLDLQRCIAQLQRDRAMNPAAPAASPITPSPIADRAGS